jgi:hypothetical protein
MVSDQDGFCLLTFRMKPNLTSSATIPTRCRGRWVPGGGRFVGGPGYGSGWGGTQVAVCCPAGTMRGRLRELVVKLSALLLPSGCC